MPDRPYRSAPVGPPTAYSIRKDFVCADYRLPSAAARESSPACGNIRKCKFP
jgi:hypothetical protein